MDSVREIENRFVNAFITKERRERSLWALKKTGVKRAEFLSRFHNHWPSLINEKKCTLIDITASNETLNRIISELKLKESDLVYTISYYSTDGQLMPLKAAFDACESKGAASLIISGDGSKFYFKAELEIGPPKKYLGIA